jgi:hypothetical protein
MNEAARYDSSRGTFVTFCYVLIHSRLHSLKRDKYERHDAPCTRCPLHAWNEKKQKCNLFEVFSNCQIYHRWEIKNQSKKLLTAPREGVSERVCGRPEGEDYDNYDFFIWLGKIVTDKEGLEILITGGALPNERRTLLMRELRECIEDEGLE